MAPRNRTVPVWSVDSRRVRFFLGVLVVVAHLLSDVLTPMGIAPFWPLSSKRYSLSLVDASNAPANYLLLLFGVSATVAVLWLAGIIDTKLLLI